MMDQPNNIDENENWDKCPKCGSPVLLNPETGMAENCSNCESQASATGGWIGLWFITLLVLGVVALVYFSIQILFGF
jgi:uncharacterized protein (DUF983 family)